MAATATPFLEARVRHASRAITRLLRSHPDVRRCIASLLRATGTDPQQGVIERAAGLLMESLDSSGMIEAALRECVAEVAGYSRQHMLRLRKEEVEPTLGAIRRITAACIVIADDPAISPLDLFPLVPDERAIDILRERFDAMNGEARLRDIRATGRTVKARKR